MYNVRILIVLFLLLCSGCSSQAIFPSKPPRSYQTQSSQYYNFLVGELAFKNEDLERSYQHYQSLAAKANNEDPGNYILRLLEISLTKKQVEESIYLLQEKIRINPELIDYILLGDLLLVDNNEELAKTTFDQGIKAFPKADELLIAKFFGEIRSTSDANSLIDEIAKIRNEKVRNFTLPLLAEAYAASDNLEEANRVFKQCHILESECVALENEYLEFLIRSKNTSELQDYLKTTKIQNRKHAFARDLLLSIEQDPAVSERLESLIEPTRSVPEMIRDYNFKYLSSFISQQNINQSIISLQVFSLMYPDFIPVRFYLATFFNNLKKYDLAVQEFMSVPAESPHFLKSRLGAVTILQQMRKVPEASKVMEELVGIKTYQGDLELWLVYIRLLHAQRKFSVLEDLLPDLLEKFPNEQALMFEYAVVLQELNRDSECLEILAQILELNPNHQDALNFVAFTYAEAGTHLDIAHQYVDQALVFDPQSAYFIDTKAWIFYKQANYPAALEQMNRALKFLPDDPVLLEHYGDIIKELGDTKKAQEYYLKSSLIANQADLSSEIRKLKVRLKSKISK